MEPDFVHTLSSGVEPTDDPVTLDQATEAELDAQTREMRDARESAALSSRDYIIRG